MDENKLKRFNKIFPWYDGLSGDLLFWIAIDTLFLTVVKKFTASQIVSLTTISMIVNILLQVPLLKIIHKIGNTKSVRLGSFLLLISSILLTFGKNYITIVIGKIFYEMAFTFQNMINAALKNNLELQHKENEYIKYRTKANTIYAAVTMIISFVASIMFNINNYLPMIGCITFCVICFILSWYMVDYSKDNKNKLEKNKETGKGKIKYTEIIIFILLSYGLCYPMVNSGQSNGKLFIQQELLKLYDVEKTSLVIGAILCVSRIVRLLSNIKFDKIHKKYEDKVGIMLPVGLLISLILMLIGYNVSNMPVMKFVIMGLGYVIILFIRDPFKVYMQDLALKNTDKNIYLMSFNKKIIKYLNKKTKYKKGIISFFYRYNKYPLTILNYKTVSNKKLKRIKNKEIFFWTFKNIYEANKLSKKIDNNSLYYYIINKEE